METRRGKTRGLEWLRWIARPICDKWTIQTARAENKVWGEQKTGHEEKWGGLLSVADKHRMITSNDFEIQVRKRKGCFMMNCKIKEDFSKILVKLFNCLMKEILVKEWTTFFLNTHHSQTHHKPDGSISFHMIWLLWNMPLLSWEQAALKVQWQLY